MHRVLSFQMHHGDDQGVGAVSKRLCCSFMFTTAFLSIIGGFLLGQYVTERHILLKGAQQPCTEKEKRIELIDKLSNAARTLTTTTAELKPHMITEHSPVADQLFNILQCQKVSFTDANIFHANIKEHTNEILSLHLQILTDCLNNATGYIKQEIMLGYNTSNHRK